MLSDYEDVMLPLLEENARLKRENAKQFDTITHYLNKNNDLWNKFIRAGRVDEAREVNRRGREV